MNTTNLQNTFTPTTLQIPAKLLLCIREFAARSDIRYYLNTLHFSTRAGRAYISATDGHMGGIIRSDEGAVQGPDINWLVPIELFDKLSKSHLSITFSPPMLQGQVLSAMPEAEAEDGSTVGSANSAASVTASWRCEVQLQQDAQTRSITSLEAGTRFPDMGRLFPKETGSCAAPIDSALLTRIYKAYTALKRGDGLSSKRGGTKLGNGANAHPVFGYPTQPDSVVLLDFRDLDFTGLVMPLRGQGKANTADWLWEYGQTQEQRPLDQVSDAYRAAAKARRKQQLQAERAEVRVKLEAHAQRRKQAFKDAQLAEAAAPAKSAARKPGSYPAELAHVCNLAALPTSTVTALMQATHVSDVWGIGRRLSEQLEAVGVRTAWEFFCMDSRLVRQRWGVMLERTLRELQGQSCLVLEDVPRQKQEIACTRSFGQAVTQLSSLEQAITDFTCRAAEKLRKQGSLAGQIHVFCSTSSHRQGKQYEGSVTVRLPVASQNSLELTAAALQGLAAIFKSGYAYARAGIMLMDLQDAYSSTKPIRAISNMATPVQQQLSLWNHNDAEQPDAPRVDTDKTKTADLMRALDAINQRFGRGTIQLGSAGAAHQHKDWEMRQQHRSPQYTTSWCDIVRAIA